MEVLTPSLDMPQYYLALGRLKLQAKDFPFPFYGLLLWPVYWYEFINQEGSEFHPKSLL